MELVEKLLTYYKENKEDFADDIEQLDSWNACLYDDRIFSMDELDDVLQGINPSNILYSAFYGYDEPYKNSEQNIPFNPNRDYFYFNGYGNLVSIDEKDYSTYLEQSFIQEIIDNSNHLSLSEGALAVIDDYEVENE